MKIRTRYCFPFLLFFCITSANVFAQPTWTFDPFGKEKKPKEYEEKVLGSEKTADKKFTRFRRFTQNTITHYNFYFNAKNKLNTVLERAKLAQKDDYSKLLTFYPYILENTASQQVELDSVIYKSTGGILLHDLRTDWVDNLYLLIGKSYYYRKLYDSAALTFQFINYNLFPRNKNEDDNRIVGANNTAKTTKLSIADREKRNIIQKTFTLPPSRNDALIWLARTYIEADQIGEAAGLINILQEDPNLPKRLKDDLNQVTSYWYFKQEGYDSAAVYLERGLTSADDKLDLSRWQYLLGQLFEMTNQFDKANEYYTKSAKHTVDPLMDIYSHLNNAKMLRNTGNTKELDNSIATLLKMATKDKYETYRDIIFHSAGVLSLKKPDTLAAIVFFEKSLVVNENNLSFKNKAHLQLGRISYVQRQYKKAADHYDSLDLNEPSLLDDSTEVADRKATLRKVALELGIIENEDSLQMIAALPPAERDAFLKKLVKKYRKETEVKTDDNITEGNLLTSFGNGKDNAPVDLFATSSKGEWYFYNASMKSKGYSEFKSKWGKRDNADNWRRKSAMNNLIAGNKLDATDPLAPGEPVIETGRPLENSYDAFLLNLPLSTEKLDSSNIKIANALLELAKLFQNELIDYQQSIYTYEIYMQRFPDKLAEGEVYLGLYYCYTKIGDKEKAAYYKNLLDTKFGESKFAKMINDPQSLQPEKNNPTVSKKYESIYDLFIQGSFDSAFALKKIADSIYGKQYWTPQLLYIESMYYIKCSQDSDAITTLNNLLALNPDSLLKSKAQTLIDVLSRRKQIESYLSELEIARADEDDKIIMPDEQNTQLKKQVPVTPSTPKLTGIKTLPTRRDSSIQLPPSMISGAFKWQPGKPHYVIMILDKVDAVYVNETKNAYKRYNNSNNFSSVVINKDTLDNQRSLLIFTTFENADDAIVYHDKIKKAAASQVSWLQASKYSFMIINEDNLQLLKHNKDLENYKKLLNNQYPGKF